MEVMVLGDQSRFKEAMGHRWEDPYQSYRANLLRRSVMLEMLVGQVVFYRWKADLTCRSKHHLYHREYRNQDQFRCEADRHGEAGRWDL